VSLPQRAQSPHQLLHAVQAPYGRTQDVHEHLGLCRHVVAEERAELRRGFEEIRIEAHTEFLRPLGDVSERRLHEEDHVGLDEALTGIQDGRRGFPLEWSLGGWSELECTGYLGNDTAAPRRQARARGTVEAIERRLMVDGFVRRYATQTAEDGLPAGEGAFLACSCWLVDNLVLLGRLDDARQLFERLLAVRNDLGLLSEEYDPTAKRLIGNFPQAFSHIALINSAYNLDRAAKPAEQRSGAKAPETDEDQSVLF
jgi:hypothetical protein